MKHYKKKTCENCGCMFTPNSPIQKCCSKSDCVAFRKRTLSEINRRYKTSQKSLAVSSLWRKNHPDRLRLYRSRRPMESIMFHNAKDRAKDLGIPFAITIQDIKIPSVCPVLGIPLIHGAGLQGDGSPSLDRIVPSLGYVTGNIIVVSWLANRIKTDATPEQVLAVGEFYMRIKGGIRCAV